MLLVGKVLIYVHNGYPCYLFYMSYVIRKLLCMLYPVVSRSIQYVPTMWHAHYSVVRTRGPFLWILHPCKRKRIQRKVCAAICIPTPVAFTYSEVVYLSLKTFCVNCFPYMYTIRMRYVLNVTRDIPYTCYGYALFTFLWFVNNLSLCLFKERYRTCNVRRTRTHVTWGHAIRVFIYGVPFL